MKLHVWRGTFQTRLRACGEGAGVAAAGVIHQQADGDHRCWFDAPTVSALTIASTAALTSGLLSQWRASPKYPAVADTDECIARFVARRTIGDVSGWSSDDS